MTTKVAPQLIDQTNGIGYTPPSVSDYNSFANYVAAPLIAHINKEIAKQQQIMDTTLDLPPSTPAMEGEA
jgi:hypothetical protein